MSSKPWFNWLSVLLDLRCKCDRAIVAGFVGFSDVLEVVASWGPCLGCLADVNNDGAVEFADLLQVLADYGDCF